MTTLGKNFATYADELKNSSEGDVINMMMQKNEILEDVLMLEANKGEDHSTTELIGLPEATVRNLNRGVPPSKATRQQVTDTGALFEGRSEVDELHVNRQENKSAYRMTEAKAHIEGLSNTFAENLFYGNPKENAGLFMGFAPRFNDMNAKNKDQIIDAGGTGNDNTSIWIVKWSPTDTLCFHPKNIAAGVQHENKEIEAVKDDKGGTYYAYVDQFKLNVGLSVRNWKNVVRIANIDVAKLAKAGEDDYVGANLINLLIRGVDQLEDANGGKVGIYCSKKVRTALRLLAANKKNVLLSLNEVAGKKVLEFDSHSVRRVDALRDTEGRVQ